MDTINNSSSLDIIVKELTALYKENERAIEMANHDIETHKDIIENYENKILENKLMVAKLEMKAEEYIKLNNKLYNIISQYTTSN